ncbi:MAG: mevalonate kinase [Candidatus Asgardarchaeia archaeon]
MRHSVASAPGKVILFGEHSVVYGEPAIAVAINLRAYVRVDELDGNYTVIEAPHYSISKRIPLGLLLKPTLPDFPGMESVLEPIYVCIKETIKRFDELPKPFKVRIDSKIPPGAGLGSSAAVNVATAAALSDFMGCDVDLKEINSIAYEAERIVHGSPSGIDNTIATFGGAIYYKKPEMKKFEVRSELPLIVGDTGIERRTRDLVEKVRRLYDRNKEIVSRIFSIMGEISKRAYDYMMEGEVDALGTLMNLNHGLLVSLGVSNIHLDKLVHTALESGALGAKLTGAGGGGCMVALVKNERMEEVASSMRKLGYSVYSTKLSKEGVRIEESCG